MTITDGELTIAFTAQLENTFICGVEIIPVKPQANDAVHAFLYQPQWITVANSKLKGLWKDMPIFANDLAALSWQ